MNVHPIVVHFPIAFLTAYAILEILAFKSLRQKIYWFYIKASLVILGAGGAAAALLTGEMVEDLAEGDRAMRQVLHLHEAFAKATLLIFSLIALGYAILWIYKELEPYFGAGRFSVLKAFLLLPVKVSRFFLESPIAILLALLGLACITLTGGLGGVMVHGPDADPFFRPIYHFLVR